MANRLLTKAEVLDILQPAADIIDDAFAEFRSEHPGEECWVELIPPWFHIHFAHKPCQSQ